MSLDRSQSITWLAPAAAVIGLVSTCVTLAEDAAPKDEPPATAPAKAKKPMKMDQPMAGEMKKEGMTKGDMKKAAEKKERDMRDVMEKEEKAMKKP